MALYTATLTDTDGVVVQTLSINAPDDASAKTTLTAQVPDLTAEDAGNIGTWTLTTTSVRTITYP